MDPLTIAGLGFTAVTVASLVGLHIGKVVVPRVGRFREPPDIYVSASAPCTLEEVKEAVEWWKAQGFKLGRVISTGNANGPVPGAVFIGLPDEPFMQEAAGHAEWLVKHPLQEDELEQPQEDFMSLASDILGPIDGGFIRYAVIGIDPLVPRGSMIDVIKHELGHGAIGFLHCETALFGRRKKDGKKRKAGEAKLGVVGRKTGHVMNPMLSKMGDNTKGMTAP